MGTTSIPGVFTGAPCPMNIRFGYSQGPSPVAGSVTLPGNVVPQIGSLQVLNIGPSVFVGYVVGQEYDLVSDTTAVHLVDWRDRLHDIHVAASFNIQEDDGRFYHILPGNWFAQRKTYVTRELGQADFDTLQRYPQFAFTQIQVAKNTLYSAATLLDWFGRNLGFVVTADNLALQKLLQTYPLNLDWNNASTKAIDAIQQIMQKCGTQFTCFGYNRMHVSIRGWTENALTAAVANNLINPCAIGISSGKTGLELNEQGRRVAIIGDRNKHEFVYPCRANWNPNWTWGMVYNGIEMSSLLEANNLTLDSKVGEMPERYHDEETISEYDASTEGPLPSRKTRNLMTIKDYMEKIAFKAYVVDSRFAVNDFYPVTENEITGDYYEINNEDLQDGSEFIDSLMNFPRTSEYNNDQCNFKFPVSRTLVTDSNLQHITYATSVRIIRGADHPFGVQNTLVPMTKGTTLEVEEVTNPLDGEAEFRVRVYFSQPQVYLVPNQDFTDPNSVQPDMVLVRLSLDADQFVYFQGDFSNSVRVREQVQNVRNLYNAYVDGDLASVLRENIRRDLEKGGQSLSASPVTAQQIAQRIATQLLAHYAITKSGSFTFEDICGSTPDGLIDNVAVNYSAEAGGGIRETVNFTTGFADDREFVSPFTVTVSRKFRDEEELIKDRLKDIAKAASVDAGLMGKVMPIFESGLHEPGGLLGVPVAALAYAREGITEVEFPVEFFDGGETATGGALIGIWKPGAAYAGPPKEEE
jgi:hypothetical protein